MARTKVILLNALPVNAFAGRKVFTLVFSRKTVKELKEIIEMAEKNKVPVESYIRHPATVEFLKKNSIDVEASSGLYQYNENHIIFVVTLLRPVRGAEIEKISEEEVLIYQVYES